VQSVFILQLGGAASQALHRVKVLPALARSAWQVVKVRGRRKRVCSSHVRALGGSDFFRIIGWIWRARWVTSHIFWRLSASLSKVWCL